MFWAEVESMEAALGRKRQIEQLKTNRFLDWIHEATEQQEKAESKERIRELERENESLREFLEQYEGANCSEEEFQRDMMLSDEAEVLSDLLAQESSTEPNRTTCEPVDLAEALSEAAESLNTEAEAEEEEE